MFPEHSDLIAQLKSTDAHFASVFTKHESLDHQIARMEDGKEPSNLLQLEQLKKTKLALKDEAYAMLQKAKAA
jgi:uncharacterized protein YdcH (DUF465 family)